MVPEVPRRTKRGDRGIILLGIAIIGALVYHGGLLLAGSYQRTYDAWVHIFFADHYRRDWFSSWEPRWYTGFTTVSYPPGTHQLVALASSFLSLPTAFVLVQTAALVLLTIGVFRFSLIWVDREAAGWAAILLVTSTSIAETVHVFGQLPTTFSLGFLLNSLPFAHRWVKDGHAPSGLVGLACAAACTAGHHVTTLFGSVFFLGPVLVHALMERLRTPLPGEEIGRAIAVDRTNFSALTARRLRRILRPTARAAVYGICVIVALVVVVLAYWLWSRSDPITQVSIPHASRDSFITNTNAGLVFWLIPWGLALFALPYAIVRGLFSASWPLVTSLLLLTLLGTGGTTPIPRLLLGGAYNILTLDRFTFWATIIILPFTGKLAASLAGGRSRRWLTAQVGPILSKVLVIFLGVAALAASLFAANLTHYRAFQPTKIDAGPIVSFIEKDEHWRWRYLTLGFGDQMAWISAQTTASTVDGNYHSARRLPELTSTRVERLEGAKYSGVSGLGSLQQFLSVPERYHLKYVFSNDKFYDPLLGAAGWTALGVLENGVYVWERADVTPLPPALVDRNIPKWQRILWGTLPLTSIALAVTGMLWALAGFRTPRRVNAFIAARSNRGVSSNVGPWQFVDRKMERIAAKVDPDGLVPRAWKVNRYVEALKSRPWPRPTLRRRRWQGIGAVFILLPIALIPVLLSTKPVGADTVVADYFIALDLRKFAEAYQMLDPASRPPYDMYRKDQLADGGLVASYSKLNTAQAVIRSVTGNRALVRVSLQYLTSLLDYDTVADIETVHVNGEWRIVPPSINKIQPSDKITTRTGVDWLIAPRSNANTRNQPDILDRPRLRITNARAVTSNGQWHVVGEVTNVDIDPADVTVTAQLRDGKGDLLAGYNASFVMGHTLFPGDTTPFRVDFEGVMGSGAGTEPSTEFNPLAATPLSLPPATWVATVDVYARAVVTDHHFTRNLQAIGLHLTTDGDGHRFLDGEIRNDGVNLVAIPHLLLTYRDATGAAIWVDHTYLRSSIAPQRSLTVHIPIDPVQTSPTTAAVRLWDMSDITSPHIPTGPPPLLTMPAESGFASLDVTAVPLL